MFFEIWKNTFLMGKQQFQGLYFTSGGVIVVSYVGVLCSQRSDNMAQGLTFLTQHTTQFVKTKLFCPSKFFDSLPSPPKKVFVMLRDWIFDQPLLVVKAFGYQDKPHQPHQPPEQTL